MTSHDDMNQQLEEFAGRITRDVTESVTAALIKTLTPALTQAVTANVYPHVTAVVTTAEQRLAEQARVNVEAVKSEAQLAAEGYAATVDAIERRLDNIEAAIGTRFTDYDGVLRDHGRRIETLEQKTS